MNCFSGKRTKEHKDKKEALETEYLAEINLLFFCSSVLK